MASGKVIKPNNPLIISSMSQLKQETDKFRKVPVLSTFTDSAMVTDMYGGSAYVEGLSDYHSDTILDNFLWGIARQVAVRYNPRTDEKTYQNAWFPNTGMFKVVNGSYSYTLAGNSYMNITAGNLGLSEQSGYIPIGVDSFDVDESRKGVVLTGLQLTNLASTAGVLTIRNTKSAQAKSKAVIAVVFMRIAL